MPVSQLLCEGGVNSPDVRVLARILAGLCEVRPMGQKYGMGERVKARREIKGHGAVYGLLDRDFSKDFEARSHQAEGGYRMKRLLDRDFSKDFEARSHQAEGGYRMKRLLDRDFSKDFEAPKNRPRDWILRKNENEIHVGWRWERKEIENYLVDPAVVSMALGEQAPDEAEYLKVLVSARDGIATYQAARAALSFSRPRFRDLPSSFGKKRGREKHLFPDELNKDACVAGIEQVVVRYRDTQLVTSDRVKKQLQTSFRNSKRGENALPTI